MVGPGMLAADPACEMTSTMPKMEGDRGENIENNVVMCKNLPMHCRVFRNRGFRMCVCGSEIENIATMSAKILPNRTPKSAWICEDGTWTSKRRLMTKEEAMGPTSERKRWRKRGQWARKKRRWGSRSITSGTHAEKHGTNKNKDAMFGGGDYAPLRVKTMCEMKGETVW